MQYFIPQSDELEYQILAGDDNEKILKNIQQQIFEQNFRQVFLEQRQQQEEDVQSPISLELSSEIEEELILDDNEIIEGWVKTYFTHYLDQISVIQNEIEIIKSKIEELKNKLTLVIGDSLKNQILKQKAQLHDLEKEKDNKLKQIQNEVNNFYKKLLKKILEGKRDLKCNFIFYYFILQLQQQFINNNQKEAVFECLSNVLQQLGERKLCQAKLFEEKEKNIINKENFINDFNNNRIFHSSMKTRLNEEIDLQQFIEDTKNKESLSQDYERQIDNLQNYHKELQQTLKQLEIQQLKFIQRQDIEIRDQIQRLTNEIQVKRDQNAQNLEEKNKLLQQIEDLDQRIRQVETEYSRYNNQNYIFPLKSKKKQQEITIYGFILLILVIFNLQMWWF